MRHTLIYVTLLGILGIVGPSHVLAAVCNGYASGSQAPMGYAAAWNVYGSNSELLVSAHCTGVSLDVTVGSAVLSGSGSPQATYNTGYYWNGAGWVAYRLAPHAGTATRGEFIMGVGVAQGLPLLGSGTYVVAYSCVVAQGVWRCGCASPGDCAKWNLQRAVRTEAPRTVSDTTKDFSTSACDDDGLVWKSGTKTHYESYPKPGSVECLYYNGCTWAGKVYACKGTKPESWFRSRSVAAVYPLDGLTLHDVCIRSGTKTMVVTAYDTCADADCDGCCTENRGRADALIDLERFTNDRWGLSDGPIEWADLGSTTGEGC